MGVIKFEFAKFLCSVIEINRLKHIKNQNNIRCILCGGCWLKSIEHFVALNFPAVSLPSWTNVSIFSSSHTLITYILPAEGLQKRKFISALSQHWKFITESRRIADFLFDVLGHSLILDHRRIFTTCCVHSLVRPVACDVNASL